jgi:hypothetical protein
MSLRNIENFIATHSVLILKIFNFLHLHDTETFLQETYKNF